MLGLFSSHFGKQNAPENQEKVIQRGAAPPVAFKQQAERAVFTIPYSIISGSHLGLFRVFCAPRSSRLLRRGAGRRLNLLSKTAGMIGLIRPLNASPYRGPRSRNCRFRDIEFDIEGDKERCLYGLDPPEPGSQAFPSDVLRVTEIFDEVG
jgi:hypothetical protein